MQQRTKTIIGILAAILLGGVSMYLSSSGLFKGLTKYQAYKEPSATGIVDQLKEYVEIPAIVLKHKGAIPNTGEYIFKVKEGKKSVKFSAVEGKGKWQKLKGSVTTPPSGSQGGTENDDDMIKNKEKLAQEMAEKEKDMSSSADEFLSGLSVTEGGGVTDPAESATMTEEEQEYAEVLSETLDEANTHEQEYTEGITKAFSKVSTTDGQEHEETAETLTVVSELQDQTTETTEVTEDVTAGAAPIETLEVDASSLGNDTSAATEFEKEMTSDKVAPGVFLVPSGAAGAEKQKAAESVNVTYLPTAHAFSLTTKQPEGGIILNPGESAKFTPSALGEDAVWISVSGEFHVLLDIVEEDKARVDSGQVEEPDHPAPTGVTISKAIMAGFENIAVYWTKPAPTMANTTIEGYVISAKFKGANGQYIDTAEYESTESASATLHAVKGTSYFNNGATSVEAKVKAKYKDGTDSDWSNTATYTLVEVAAAPPGGETQPAATHPAPSNLIATADASSIVISWQAPASTDLAISNYILQIQETNIENQSQTYEEEVDPSITSLQVPKDTIEEGIAKFEFLIRAKYADGVISELSNKATYNVITQEVVVEETVVDDSEDPPVEEEEEVVQPTGEIKIKNADIWPKGFNPSLVLTKISFETTGTALVTVEIRSSTGQKIVTLVDDEEAKADKYEIYWDGTDDPAQSKGKVVPQGEYTWKVTAKDPTSKAIKDSKSGDVNVVYNPGGADFEGNTGSGSSNTTTSTSAASASAESAQNAQNTLAMLSLQSASSGETAGTGPGTLIYLFLPAAGLIFRRGHKHAK